MANCAGLFGDAYDNCIAAVAQKGTSVGDTGGIIGTITNPINTAYGDATSGGLILFFSNILRLLFVGAGIYALINFIMGGFGFMSAGGDSKKIGEAWSKIWQTLMGLVFIVGSFALAALFGQLIFGNANFILSPKIYGPGN